MRGVGDELALRAARVGERLEHGVERAREAGQLVVADRVDPAREVLGGGDVARAPHQPPHGPHGAAADDAAEHRGQHHAAEADEHKHERDPAHGGVDVLERLRGLERLSVGERADVDAHLGAGQLGVVEERLRAALGHGQHARPGGQQGRATGRRLDAAGARHHLGVALFAERGGREQEQELAALLLALDLAARGAGAGRRLGRHPLVERAQVVVDRVAQLGAHGDVGGDGGHRHREGHGHGGEQREAAAVRHGQVVSMKPTPRTVWMSRGSPLSSVLRRR